MSGALAAAALRAVTVGVTWLAKKVITKLGPKIAPAFGRTWKFAKSTLGKAKSKLCIECATKDSKQKSLSDLRQMMTKAPRAKEEIDSMADLILRRVT